MVRFKNRYLVVEVLPVNKDHELSDYQPGSGKAFNTHQLAGYLRTALAMHFGILTSALTSQSLSLKYANATTGTAIIRTSRDSLHQVWACLTLLTGLPDQESSEQRWLWRVVHVAGTIRGAQKATMKHSLRRLEEAGKNLKAEELEKFKESLRKCQQAIAAIDP